VNHVGARILIAPVNGVPHDSVAVHIHHGNADAVHTRIPVVGGCAAAHAAATAVEVTVTGGISRNNRTSMSTRERKSARSRFMDSSFQSFGKRKGAAISDCAMLIGEYC
jgi:hypothetical protein